MDDFSRTALPNGVVSRGFTEVEFVDQYGEKRTIYRQRGQALRVKKRKDSVSHLLNRAAAKLTGQRIKAARLAAGMSLDELHDKAGLTAAPGLSKQRMYEIENAGKNHRGSNANGVRFGTLYALAIALECDAADLLPTKAEVMREAGLGLVSSVATRIGAVE